MASPSIETRVKSLLVASPTEIRDLEGDILNNSLTAETHELHNSQLFLATASK